MKLSEAVRKATLTPTEYQSYQLICIGQDESTLAVFGDNDSPYLLISLYTKDSKPFEIRSHTLPLTLDRQYLPAELEQAAAAHGYIDFK